MRARPRLWFDPAATPRFTRMVEIDLSGIGLHVAGPRRPQDLLAVHQTREALAGIGFVPRTPHADLPRHAIAIAAITSCTNTSDPRLLVAAGLVARKARARGLSVPAWVKTSLAPGSPAAVSYLERAGLTEDLAAVGFQIVGHGCTTCIGNSGPLPEVVRQAMALGQVHPVAVLSGNRNFAGRVHPDLDLGFLMSPPLVVAFALAGDAERNLRDEPVQQAADGQPVGLGELWPTDAEIDACLALGLRADDFRRDFARASATRLARLAEPDRRALPVGTAFDHLAPAAVRCGIGRLAARLLHRRIRCWCWVTTSPPTTSRRPAASRATARWPTSSSSRARTATTSMSSPPGAATGR